MGQEVGDEDQILVVRYGLYESVPCDDEVGEDEEDGAEGEEAAALQQRSHHHGADQACVDGNTYTENSRICAWDNADKDHRHECQGAEYYHGEVPFCLHGQFPVTLDLIEIPADEICNIHDVRERERAHLGQKVSARTEIVSGCGEKKRQRDLPRA